MPPNYLAYTPDDKMLHKFVDQYETAFEECKVGKLSTDMFRSIRIDHGIHSHHHPVGVYMVRIKMSCSMLA